MSTEIIRSTGEVVPASGALMPVVSIQDMLLRYDLLTKCVQGVMRDGRDYGVIPGTERKAKPGEPPPPPNKTLLKPGAEKLCTLFGMTPDFQEDKIIADFDHGLFFFSYRCVLLRNARQEIIEGKPIITGDVVGVGIGSTNSREKKFQRTSRLCPECGKPAIIKGKEEYGGGWLCFKKKDGCGAKFRDDAPESINQSGQTSADDSADQLNNMQKMACKRALVSAVLVATNASELFSQDLEDMEPPPRQEQRQEPKPAPNGAGKDFARDHAQLLHWIAQGAAKATKEGRPVTEAALQARVFAAVEAGGVKGEPKQWGEPALRIATQALKAALEEIRKTPAPFMDAEQLEALDNLMREVGVTWPKVADSLKLGDVQRAALTPQQYRTVMDALKRELAGEPGDAPEDAPADEPEPMEVF